MTAEPPFEFGAAQLATIEFWVPEADTPVGEPGTVALLDVNVAVNSPVPVLSGW